MSSDKGALWMLLVVFVCIKSRGDLTESASFKRSKLQFFNYEIEQSRNSSDNIGEERNLHPLPPCCRIRKKCSLMKKGKNGPN